MSLEWEVVVPIKNYDYTERLKVPGGWVVCRIDGGKSPQSMAMCFISDPDHTWELEKASVPNEPT